MNSAETKPLNKLEVWVAEHAVPIFAGIALAIVLGAVAVFVTYQQQSGIAERVKVLSPQVTKVSKAICDQESLHHSNRAESCAERIRVGLVNCRKVLRCRAALLAIVTYPPPAKPTSPSSTTAPDQEGGATQQPSNNGHQHPGPGSQPGHGHGNHGGGEAAPAPSPTPSPAPSAPEKPGNGPPVETPGKGPPAGAGGGSSSGADVEVCAAIVNTCAGAEVGLGH